MVLEKLKKNGVNEFKFVKDTKEDNRILAYFMKEQK